MNLSMERVWQSVLAAIMIAGITIAFRVWADTDDLKTKVEILEQSIQFITQESEIRNRRLDVFEAKLDRQDERATDQARAINYLTLVVEKMARNQGNLDLPNRPAVKE